ncbi:hypothetical protein D1AOALGA4SA_10531 [Olavius algarvensis Delta 1 endosymbiont]|nr:hypothetical protein D1AOALGA4SA_10531 [Olavius algarvensis Delta 1 endosymbiont]
MPIEREIRFEVPKKDTETLQISKLKTKEKHFKFSNLY